MRVEIIVDRLGIERPLRAKHLRRRAQRTGLHDLRQQRLGPAAQNELLGGVEKHLAGRVFAQILHGLLPRRATALALFAQKKDLRAVPCGLHGFQGQQLGRIVRTERQTEQQRQNHGGAERRAPVLQNSHL